jgi:hypothetical protein
MDSNLTFGNETLLEEHSHFENFLLVLKISITLTTVSLNSLIVYIAVFQIKNKIYSDCLFLSMALADLSIGIVCMPNITVSTTLGYSPLGYAPCLAWIIIDFSSCTISMYSLTLLCLHRLRQIITPTKVTEHLTKKKVFVILLLWFITYAGWTVSVVLIMRSETYNGYNCLMGYTFIYNMLSQFFSFMLPYASILILNLLTIIALKIKSRKMKLAKNKKRVLPNQTTNGMMKSSLNGNSINMEPANSSQQPRSVFKKENKENRAYLSISVISFSLFLFWSAFLITYPMKAICNECISEGLYTIFYYLVYLQALSNPISLIVFHEKFRTHFFVNFNRIKRFFMIC